MDFSKIRNLLLFPFMPLLARLAAKPKGARAYPLVIVAVLATLAGAVAYAVSPVGSLLVPAVLALPAIPLVLYYLVSAEFTKKGADADHPFRVVINTLIGASLASQLALQLKIVGWFGFGVILLLAIWLLLTAIASAYLMKEA